MNLDNVTVEDLVASERFQSYCLESNFQDRHFFEQWANKTLSNKKMLEEAKSIVLMLNLQLDENEVAAAYEELKSSWSKQNNQTNTKIVFMNQQSKAKHPPTKWWSLVASVAIVITIGFFGWNHFFKNSPVYLATGFGEMKTHVLPDGSTVILNANSTLSYNENWNGLNRLVQLEGEAFFEVQKKASNASFEVMTSKGTIKVLGTSFNVRQRSKQFEVALLEGKIALGLPEQPVLMMKPGEIAKLKSNGTVDISRKDVDASSAWRFQRMVFKEVTIEEITKRLKEEFDITVIISNEKLFKRKVNASIPKNDPVLLLEALSEIYEIEVETTDNKTFTVR
ncbi:MAG: FecR domain-containing protein [Bacteroidota bacterium]